MKPFNFTAPYCEYHDGDCDCPEQTDGVPSVVEEDETTPVPNESMRQIVWGAA